jgi:hypothetical protein
VKCARRTFNAVRTPNAQRRIRHWSAHAPSAPTVLPATSASPGSAPPPAARTATANMALCAWQGSAALAHRTVSAVPVRERLAKVETAPVRRRRTASPDKAAPRGPAAPASLAPTADPGRRASRGYAVRARRSPTATLQPLRSPRGERSALPASTESAARARPIANVVGGRLALKPLAAPVSRMPSAARMGNAPTASARARRISSVRRDNVVVQAFVSRCDVCLNTWARCQASRTSRIERHSFGGARWKRLSTWPRSDRAAKGALVTRSCKGETARRERRARPPPGPVPGHR